LWSGDEQGVRAILDMSIKSANETEYHLLCARDFDLLLLDDWQKFSTETVEIRKMIYAYRKKVLNSDRGAG
jgi:four helix bundle protein